MFILIDDKKILDAKHYAHYETAIKESTAAYFH